MNPASAKTSVNQIPFLHKWIARSYTGGDKFCFDFGAGKHGKVDQFMIDQKIAYAPYDPFNRLPLVNEHSMKVWQSGACDFVTCSNVLNVLEDEHLDTVLDTLVCLTNNTKMRVCYVTVYHKASLPKNRQVGNHFQRNEPLDWYKEKLEQKFDTVIKNGKVLICLLAKG